jgi:CRP-like cAMP-binding protein
MAKFMSNIIKSEILKVHPFFETSKLDKIGGIFKSKHFNAKEHILREGHVCDHLILAENSVTRCYYTGEEGKEHTLWMKPEKTFLTEYKSFVHRNPSTFNLQFYEDTLVYYIHRDDLLKLYKSDNDWAQFGLYLTEHLHITLIDVFVNLLSNDATRNYQYIAYAFPKFLQVAPLKDIASMLQVSQVTLSRIRAGTQTKN